MFFFSIEKRKDDSSPKKRVNSKQNDPKSSPANSLDYGVLCPCCDRVFQDLSSAVSILILGSSYFMQLPILYFSNFRKDIGRVRMGLVQCQILRKRLGINLLENWQLLEFPFWNLAILCVLLCDDRHQER